VLWENMNGVDNRKWEVRERKSIATQISWGVRFDQQSQVNEFLDRIALTASGRMEKLGLKGKCVSLKLWRAVAEAPDHMRKVCCVSLSLSLVLLFLKLITLHNVKQ
jgi:DNA repair protein REV1